MTIKTEPKKGSKKGLPTHSHTHTEQACVMHEKGNSF